MLLLVIDSNSDKERQRNFAFNDALKCLYYVGLTYTVDE